MLFERDIQGKDIYVFKCPTCSFNYQHGPQIYNGRKLSGYQLQVCKNCYDGNWDGWTSQHNKLLLNRCKELGINPPSYNKKGYLPRDF